MKKFNFFIKISFPLLMILSMRFYGTSHDEYWSNFEKVEGELTGPTTLLEINHELVFNDSIRLLDDKFDVLSDEFEELGLKKAFYAANRSMWDGFNKYTLDSIADLTEEKWNSLKRQHEKPVKEIDSVFEKGPKSKQVKIALWQVLQAKPYFSVAGHSDKFTLSEFDEQAEEEDEYGLDFKIEYRGSGMKLFENRANLGHYLNHLKVNLKGSEGTVTVTRLRSDENIVRAYIVEDLDGDIVFKDEYGFEALAILSNEKGSFLGQIDGEPNEKFILWYDNWIVKTLAVVQIVIYLFVGLILILPGKQETADKTEA